MGLLPDGLPRDMVIWGIRFVGVMGILTFTADAVGRSTISKSLTVVWTLYCAIVWLLQRVNRSFSPSSADPNVMIFWFAVGLAFIWAARLIRGGDRRFMPSEDSTPLE